MEREQGISRRQILKVGMLSGMGLFLFSKMGIGTASGQVPAVCPELPATPALTPFVDQLPIPPILRPTRKEQGIIYYDLSADQSIHQFHRDLPPTSVWEFNGMIPGPTIEVWKNSKVRVTVANNLVSYIFCPDLKVHGAWPVPYLTLHNHGILDREDSDGFPEARFPPGVSYTYEYPNIQEAGTFWYHDHSLGVTRLSVNSGLAGFYIIRDKGEEWRLRLPSGEFEVPIVVKDRSFNPDGSLWLAYPWQPEFFGDVATVNGKVWPYLEVKRGKYRLRILNASNARFYNLKLDPPPPPDAFLQIGTDGGLLPSPVDLTDPTATPMGGLLLSPSERADVIIDFSAYAAGTQVILKSDAPAPFPGGGETPLDTIMSFNVTSDRGWIHPIPRKLSDLPKSTPSIKTRYLTLVDYGSPAPGYPPPPNPPDPDSGNLYPTLLLNNLEWTAPPTETPKAGSTEIWNLINLAPDTHPIHVHQTEFRILGRQNFDVGIYLAQYGVNGPLDNPTIPFTGAFMPPYPFEDGLKDTVRANPAQVTTIEIPFGPFRGRFVWHCHILDHEDNEMMRPFLIT